MLRICLIAFSCALTALATELPLPTGIVPLQELTIAPQPIQKASQAVVRIRTRDGGIGTGFFVAPTSQLVTNAHVVGAENCSREGCYIDIDLNFQRGETAKAIELFVVPQFSLVDHDVTVLDVFVPGENDGKGNRYSPTATLEFSQNKFSIGKDTLFAVGHPYGGLKRWSDGLAFQINGDWCLSTNCVSEGSSGSPMLNSEGKIVGIVHRTRDIGSEITDLSTVRTMAIFSLAAQFQRMIASPEESDPSRTLASFLSVPFEGVKKITEQDIEDGFGEIDASTLLVLKSRNMAGFTAVFEGEETEVDLLGLALELCEEELTVPELVNDPDAIFAHCQLGIELIDCSPEGQKREYCPSKKEQRRWRAAFEEAALIEQLKNGSRHIEWKLAGAMAFATSKELAKAAGRKTLMKELEEHQISLFEAAAFAARVSEQASDMTLNRVDYWQLLQNYSEQPFYDQYFEDIVDGISSIIKSGSGFDKTALRELVIKLLADPKLPIAEKTIVEATAYEKQL